MSEIIRDGSIAGGIPSVPQFRAVSPDVFLERAERFGALAPNHALEEYLRFAAALSRAQHALLGAYPEVTLPDTATLEQCRRHGLPPLGVDGHQRDPVWQEGLGRLGRELNAEALPAPARGILGATLKAPAVELEDAASRLLAGEYEQVDAGRAPFLAAALQVYWVKLALAAAESGFGANVRYGLCPVCASHPVASVVRIGGAAQGLRYLVCSLCASEWHVVRVKCTACASTKGIGYLGIEGADEAVKAEVCDECKTYLKIFYLEKNPSLVPAADDLASLALDMLVDEQGYNRQGPNLLFLPGRP
jgi:FdhE protein